MRVAVTGATGLIGRALVRELQARGDDVAVLTRNPSSASSELPGVEVCEWRDPIGEPAPTEAFAGRDAVVHLAGEPLAQRWTDESKRRIRESRELGTRNLVAGLREVAEPRPRVLLSQSAIGWYGARDDERLDESEPAAGDFLAQVVAAWEAEARAAEELGMRVVLTRTGVVLAESGGALEKMLPPFKLGVGGPVAGGRQYVSWIHLDDVVGAMVFCLDEERARGPVNLTAPEPVTNRELSKALGHVLKRPAVAPVPALAVKLLYGEMASIVTTGARVMPKRLEELDYEYRWPELDPALRAAVAR
ncbi:MAG TPA: TIGR01777 family oxidoreductase [Thermoleophilaceae bacterium]